MSKAISEMSEYEIKQLLELKAAVDAKKAKQALYNERRRIWMKLMIEKAEAMGIKVTDDEVWEEMNK